jgi:tRNA A37 N6-isopentenylltransferase MiaA
MELLLFVVGSSVLAILAMRYGHDSREPADSKEQTLANLQGKSRRSRQLRNWLVRALHALAARIEPSATSRRARASERPT